MNRIESTSYSVLITRGISRYNVRKHIAIPLAVANCQFLTDILINNAYMDYLELHFCEIMQYKVEKRIHFELIPTSTSRD